MLWAEKENVFRGSEKRPVLGPPSWGCLSSKKSRRGKQRPYWQGLMGIVQESDVFTMKMANHADILIFGTEEQNWKLFVYLCWQSVLGELGRLLPHHCPSVHADGDIRHAGTHSYSSASTLPVRKGFCNADGVDGRKAEGWCVTVKHRPWDYADVGIYPAPSFIRCNLK